MRNIPVVLLILITCMAIIAGCTLQTSSPDAQPQAVQAAATQAAAPAPGGPIKNVEIIQRAFDPDIVTIRTGTTVVWTNEDTVNHRVVHLPELPNDRELFHSESLSRGETFSYTFQTAGRYYYSDPQYAGGRKALVIVE